MPSLKGWGGRGGSPLPSCSHRHEGQGCQSSHEHELARIQAGHDLRETGQLDSQRTPVAHRNNAGPGLASQQYSSLLPYDIFRYSTFYGNDVSARSLSTRPSPEHVAFWPSAHLHRECTAYRRAEVRGLVREKGTAYRRHDEAAIPHTPHHPTPKTPAADQQVQTLSRFDRIGSRQQHGLGQWFNCLGLLGLYENSRTLSVS